MTNYKYILKLAIYYETSTAVLMTFKTVVNGTFILYGGGSFL
jgi:hypothetical protein